MIKLDSLTLLQRESLFKTLRIAITHHSNAIEGISLTYGETKTLLETGRTANNKPLDEHLVVLGFANAYDMVIREAMNKDYKLDNAFIKDLHYVIFDDAHKVTPHLIKKPIGAYRTDYAQIVGSPIELSSPNKIAQDIDNLLYRFPSNSLDLAQIAEFHMLYEQIHPFADGNGRTGRLLMSFQCIQNNLVPPLIEYNAREEYLQHLAKAQQHKDITSFVDFLAKCQERSVQSLDITHNIAKKQIHHSKPHKQGR